MVQLFTRARRCFSLVPAIIIGASMSSPAAAVELMTVTFDAMAIDEMVPTGGREVNEPTGVDPSVIGIVRDTPFDTPCLEITDNSEGTAGTVSFVFSDNELTDGLVTMSTVFMISGVTDNNVNIYIREGAGASQSFATLTFQPGGSIRLNDTSSAGVIGSFEYDVEIEIDLIYDMDAGTYDVIVDGAPLIEDREHGIVGRGVGSFRIGHGHDAGFDGVIYVDSVQIEAIGSTPIQTLSWQAVKESF